MSGLRLVISILGVLVLSACAVQEAFQSDKALVDLSTATEAAIADPSDGGISPVDMAVSDAPAACKLAPGNAKVGSYCDLFRLALIDDGTGVTRAHLSGRLIADGIPDGDCIVVDEVEVLQGAAAIGTLAGAGEFISGDQDGVIAQGLAFSEMTSRCADEANRADGFGFVVRGRVEGGSFEAHCADAESGIRWPPALIVTCHKNIEKPPTYGYLTVDTFDGASNSTISVSVPQSAGHKLLTVNTSIRVMPVGNSLSSPITATPFDVNDVGGVVTSIETSPQGPYADVLLSKFEDIFGTELCPIITGEDPGLDPQMPPLLLIRFSGESEAGPYSAEAYFESCTRIDF